MPRVLLPAAEPSQEPALAPPTPDAVDVQQAYVYLFLTVHRIKHGAVCPSAKIPRVAFPAAEPLLEAALAEPTPEAVEESVAYVYLFRVETAEGAEPKAKIPRVLLPAADPLYEAALAAPTPDDVEVQQAYVYLFLVVLEPHAQPKAKIPTVPSPPPVLANKPNPCAEAAPLVSSNGISYLLLELGLRSQHRESR
jgi:hypothetical protein